MFMPSILENITNWRVFDSDAQIINFLTISNTFQDAVIDDADTSTRVRNLSRGSKQDKNQMYLEEHFNS
jgi:hypothetical protein